MNVSRNYACTAYKKGNLYTEKENERAEKKIDRERN